MKVILRKNYDKLGKSGDIVDVKEGFALNFLFPRQIASIANSGNVKALEEEKRQTSRKEAKALDSAKALAAELENVSITISVKVGEEDKIFGSVTNQMVADALAGKGYNIDKRKISFTEQIKSLGIFKVNVKLHGDIDAVVKTWIVRE